MIKLRRSKMEQSLSTSTPNLDTCISALHDICCAYTPCSPSCAFCCKLSQNANGAKDNAAPKAKAKSHNKRKEMDTGVVGFTLLVTAVSLIQKTEVSLIVCLRRKRKRESIQFISCR